MIAVINIIKKTIFTIAIIKTTMAVSQYERNIKFLAKIDINLINI